MQTHKISEVILKFINGRNDSRSYLKGQLEYITDSTKTEGGRLVATQGCSPIHALEDFLLNKALHHKTHGKQGVHFVIAFPPNGSSRSPDELLSITSEIVEHTYPNYLAVMTIHTDSHILHAHVVLDAVNAITGRKFSQGKGDLNRVKQKVNAVLQTHGIGIIKSSANEFVDYHDYNHAVGYDFLELDESELISETEMRAIDLNAEIIISEECQSHWSFPIPTTSNPFLQQGGYYPMNNTTHSAPIVPLKPAEQESSVLSLTEQNVPTVSAPSCYPNTTVVTGPTFRIKGASQNDFGRVGELVEQSSRYAQDHQRESANLALAMQYKAQESGHPTNVTVVAGPIFDIEMNYSSCIIDDDHVIYHKCT